MSHLPASRPPPSGRDGDRDGLVDRLVGAQGPVDDVGEAPFEDAEGFQPAVAVGFAAGDEFSGGRMAAGLSQGDAVRAALSCRLPVRLRRCRARLDDQTRSGAVPLWRA